MYVQYDCHRPSTSQDLLRKRSARRNVKIGHSSEPEVGQSSNTPKQRLAFLFLNFIMICANEFVW